MAAEQSSDGVTVLAPVLGEVAPILTPEALGFLTKLHRAFESRRQ
jgi:hypothetical protein